MLVEDVLIEEDMFRMKRKLITLGSRESNQVPRVYNTAALSLFNSNDPLGKLYLEETVLDTESQNIPEVVVVRRGVGGILGIWVGRVNWVRGSKWDQFTSNLRGRWTIPVTTGGSQVSEVGIQRGDKGGSKGSQRGARGNAPCIYVNVMYASE